MTDTETKPVEETVAWDELRPPCTVHYPFGSSPECGRPADWWHKCVCGYVGLVCNSHHDVEMTHEGAWRCNASHGGCGRTFTPARDRIAAMGRL